MIDHSLKTIKVYVTAIQTLTRTRAVDSRFHGNDDIRGTRPGHRHSRESGNPLPLSESQVYVTKVAAGQGPSGTGDFRLSSPPLHLHVCVVPMTTARSLAAAEGGAVPPSLKNGVAS
jgi:hypothetical protein